MSSPDLIRKLGHLDPSSPRFPDHLASLLDEGGYRGCIASLKGDVLARLTECLDTALDTLHPTNPAYRKCLQGLRAICGARKMLPHSYRFPDSLPTTARWPIASRGSYDVYEGLFGDSKVCVKRLRIYSNDRQERAIDAFYQEVVLWKRLDHPNIVPLLGITTSPFQLISVWIAGGDLTEYISAYPCADRLSLLSDIADGLSYLHSCGVIHGDLKGPSILVDDAGHAHLTDFGLSAISGDSGSSGSIKDGHAVRWAAPEILNKEQPVSNRSDVYSFAMVIIEAFTGKAPFPGTAPTTVAVRILSGNRPMRPKHPDMTDSLWEITERCWDQDPQRRPDISEVVLCLRNTIDLRYDYTDVDDEEAADDTTLGSVRGRESLTRMQPSCWAAVPCAPRQIRKFFTKSRSTPDAEKAQCAGSEYDY